ncbi:MAG TPA: hypothetical protein VFQ51_09675, partial [Vicinamibacteria bacterium]|nr:hypothetical protein [Vicinamibacteria bacterium]
MTVTPIGTACTSVPLVPETVTDAVPVVAVAEAANVTVAVVPVVEGGAKVAVTPAGRPAAPNITLPVKPFRRVTVSVLTADAPCWTDTLAGLAARAKSGVCDGVTASETLTVRTNVPLVPVIVTGEVPTGVFAAAAKVTMLLLAAVDAGLNVAVAPAGRPEA